MTEIWSIATTTHGRHGGAEARSERGREVAFGLTAIDLLCVLIATMLCLGQVRSFLFPGWTVRFAIVVAVLPAGAIALLRLVRRRDVAAIAGCAFIASAIAGSLLSDAPVLSLKGWGGGDTSTLMYAGVIALWAFGGSLDGRSAVLLTNTVIVGLACGVGYGALQVAFDVQGGAYNSFPGRASGFLGNPAYFASAAVGALGWSVTHAIRQGRVFHLCLVAVFGLGVGLSASRVAFGLAVLGGCVAVATFRSKAALTAVSVAVLGFGGGWLMTTLIADTNSVTRLGSKGGDGRSTLWGYSLEAFADRPIFGWGLGRQTVAVQGRHSADFSRLYSPDDAWTDPHNILVLLLTTTGIVGTVCALVFAGAAMRRVRDVAVLVFVVMVAANWMVQPATVHMLPVTMLVFGAGHPTNLRMFADDRGRRRLVAAIPVGAVLALAVLVPGWVIRRGIIADDPELAGSGAWWYWHDPGVADMVANNYANLADEDPTAVVGMLEWSERAVHWEMDRARWHVKHALRLTRAGRHDDAAREFDRAIELQPWSLTAHEGVYLLAIITHDEAARAEALPALCELKSPMCADVAGQADSAALDVDRDSDDR